MSTNHSQTTKLSIDVLDEDEAIAPSEQKARIDGYDLARCLAFFGMVVVNYRYVMGGMSGTPDWLLSAMDVVTLRAAATFVMLAGVSMTLFWRARRGSEGPGRLSSVIRALALVVVFAGAWVVTDFYVVESAAGRDIQFGPLAGMNPGGSVDPDLAPLGSRWTDYRSALSEGPLSMFLQVGMGVCGALLLTLLLLGRRGWGPRAVLLKRVVFLAAIGFVWQPLWGGDILRFYAIYLFAGVLVLTLSWLWVIMAIGVVLTGAFWWLFRESGGAPVDTFGAPGNQWTLTAMGRELFLDGFHPALPWVAFLFAGLLIGRIDADSMRSKIGLLVLGLILAFTGYSYAEPVSQWLRGDPGPEVVRHVVGRELFVADAPAEPPAVTDASAESPVVIDDSAESPVVAEDVSLVVTWPEGFDREANAAFVSGAERLQSMVASVGEFASRSLRAVEVERGSEKRLAVVLSLSYGEDQPAPHDHKRQVESVQQLVKFWVRNERRAGQEAVNEDGSAPRWPRAVGLFAIERRLEVMPAPEGEENESLLWDTYWTDARYSLDPSPNERWAVLSNPFGFKSGPGFMMTAMGVSMSVIALSLMIASFGVFRRLLRPLVVAGQMALTLYVAHVVVGFYVLQWIGRLRGENLVFIGFYIVVAWIVAVGFANWWRAHWRRGPLEAVMRWLTG